MDREQPDGRILATWSSSPNPQRMSFPRKRFDGPEGNSQAVDGMGGGRLSRPLDLPNEALGIESKAQIEVKYAAHLVCCIVTCLLIYS